MRALASFAELAEPSDRWVASALRLACAVLFGVYLAFAGLLLANAKGGLDPAGTPLGYDFTAFHTAARLAAEGHAAATYDNQVMIAAQRAAFPGGIVRLPWNYPPSFLLILLPLAALPYAWAWVAWTGATVAAHAAVARTIWPRAVFWPLMLAPAAALDLLFGQNGLLSLVLLGAGMALLPARPFLAGFVLGLLSYKPHLALLVPVALLIGREWRALAGATASAVGLVGVSAAVLGIGPWLVFLRKAADPGGIAVSSSSDWHAIPSALIMVKDLGGGNILAASVHAAVALFALVALSWIWMRPSALHWRGAALAIAILLATPYARLYDFALLALPIAAFASATPRPSRWEQALQAAIWLLPLWLLNFGAAVPLGPPVLILAMCIVVRRTLDRSP
jgi:hypothetical protein